MHSSAPKASQKMAARMLSRDPDGLTISADLSGATNDRLLETCFDTDQLVLCPRSLTNAEGISDDPNLEHT